MDEPFDCEPGDTRLLMPSLRNFGNAEKLLSTIFHLDAWNYVEKPKNYLSEFLFSKTESGSSRPETEF